MNSDERQARFLVDRLQGMGLVVKLSGQPAAGVGTLPLRPDPFATLDGRLCADHARFFTVGHDRLKFFAPLTLFDLPAINVGQLESAAQIETALRRAWLLRIQELEAARAWLSGLSARFEVSGRGTRIWLPLTGCDGPSAGIWSTREIHLPSSGPLAELRVLEPRGRRYRPAASLDCTSELELAITQALEAEVRRQAVALRRSTPTRVSPTSTGAYRVLVVDADRATLSATAKMLEDHGFEVSAKGNGAGALSAFRARSYDLAVVDVRLPREDGLELTRQLLEAPGIEQLPIVLVDERPNRRTRESAHEAGAVAYLPKPLVWKSVGSALIELLEQPRRRRFVRYPARLSIRASEISEAEPADMTSSISRGGISIASRRDLQPGRVERFCIGLPGGPAEGLRRGPRRRARLTSR